MVCVNFLPPDQRGGRDCLQKLIWFLTVGFFILAVSISFFYFCLLQRQEAKWQQAWDHYQLLLPMEASRREEAQMQEQIERKGQLVQKVLQGSLPWGYALDTIGKRLPPQVWLQEISAEAGGQLRLKGMALTQRDVVAFMKNLESQPAFSGLSLGLVEADEQRLEHFELSLRLKRR
ncbi:PilN domain-containing protein [Anaeromusa acidaminophila]|uniref:PilN domain-containing protein n=1 Tax=Anaeromusa acidaminophila TaxID=81464 RepID=UPI00036847D1|nr:PilN domain-containing protein [Anaeromusa acidaminophila]